MLRSTGPLQDRFQALTKEPDIGNSEGIEAEGVAMEGQTPHCGHSCTQHVGLLDPALWRTLPKDLLHLVFARLPMPEIVRRRCISKEWNWYVIAKESPFRRVSASSKACTNMFAIATEFVECSCVFTVRLYDANSSRWHSFEIPDIDYGGKHGDKFDTMVASGGGLVCLFSGLLRFPWRFEHKPIVILVGNPLTRELKALPPSSFLNVNRQRWYSL